jgi:hypothetical protein
VAVDRASARALAETGQFRVERRLKARAVGDFAHKGALTRVEPIRYY